MRKVGSSFRNSRYWFACPRRLRCHATPAAVPRWQPRRGLAEAICLVLFLPLAVTLRAETPWLSSIHAPLPACTIEGPVFSVADAAPEAPPPPAFALFQLPAITDFAPLSYAPITPSVATRSDELDGSTDWSAALHQSARFLFIQHAVRIGTQRKTRRELRGPFFRDYIHSVRGISGWDDGDSFLTNYVGHPMQGSISGYFQVHSNPRDRMLGFSSNSAYWKSRLKAMAFNAAYSTHYELGPLGEAAIGNVGLRPGTKGAVDLVITPTLGFVWMVGEDAIDAKIIAPLERRLRYPGSRRLLRTALNPTRTFANVLRGAAPWRRDSRGDVK